MAGTATTDTHSIVLEAWYLRGGTTPPVEYVPSTDKEVLNLDDADDDNDLILPFGIRYKYRIRAVDVLGREGLPVETEALLPMQDGLPPTVLIFPHLSAYDPLPLEGTQVIDEEACRQDYGPEFLAECLAGEDSDYVRTSGPQPRNGRCRIRAHRSSDSEVAPRGNSRRTRMATTPRATGFSFTLVDSTSGVRWSPTDRIKQRQRSRRNSRGRRHPLREGAALSLSCHRDLPAHRAVRHDHSLALPITLSGVRPRVQRSVWARSVLQ